jgi:uncharacterized protein (TIGR03437 family)
MILRFAAIAFLASQFLQSAPAGNFFEPAGEQYTARVYAQLVTVSNQGILIGTPVDGGSVFLEWRGGRQSELRGEEIQEAVSRYFVGSNPAQWRTSVPHFTRLSMRDLYRKTHISYYFQDGNFEFDIHLEPGASLRQLRFTTPGVKHWLAQDGSVALESRGQTYRLRSPAAYQMDGTGAREPVECHYVLHGAGEVGFRLGTYDHNRDLVIDPVLEFLTYLGGSGLDQIQAMGTDSAGNIVVAGTTSSPDFPGGGAPADSTSIFVTKLNSTGTSLLFTTILGSQQSLNAYALVPGITALAVDSDGSIVVTGQSYATNFPTTPGAWQTNPGVGFVTRLDSAGKLIYSTYLGPADWGLVAQRVRVRGGIAYLAGEVSAPEFYGTTGAFQQNVDGSSDLFAVAITADGSAPIFATAMGGSGAEMLSDMALDADGNIVLIGTSTSPDLPLTMNALSYAPPASGTSEAMLVRIDPTGSRLVSSTWLGTTSADALTTVPDGGIVIAGGSPLPSGLVSGAPHYSANPAGTTGAGYVAKFPLESNQPAWTTDLIGDFTSSSVSSDGVGNLYFIGEPPVVSGGSLGFYSGGPGISKLSADGSLLVYVSSIPGGFIPLYAAVSTVGTVAFAGSTYGDSLPTTPGVVQPQPVEKIVSPLQGPFSDDTSGFVGALDLSGFNGGNFFVNPSTSALTLAWRIGEPVPAAVELPIPSVGQVGPLSVTATSGLVVTYSTTLPSAVSINVNTSQTVTGTLKESVTIQAPSIPNAVLSVPVSLTVQPEVSFSLATSQITVHSRQGAQHNPVSVAITPDFGNEQFQFTVASSATWMSGYVEPSNPVQPTLNISFSDQPAGTYNGTLTIGLAGLPNPTRTVQVTYILDPPATIEISSTTATLHVIQGKPVTPVTLTVTGSVPGVQWDIYSGGYTWMQATQTTTATPGQIVIGVNSTTAPVGYFTATLIIEGENHQIVYINVYVDVSSGAPVDVVPTSITAEDIIGSQLSYQPPTLTMVTPNQSQIQLTADQPWILPASPLNVQTPFTLPLPLNTTLPEGVYQGNITATAGSTKVLIPVTWKLYNEPHLVFSQAPISFSYQIGGALPPAQQLQVTTPTLLQTYFSAGPTGYPNFLTVSPEGGTTPTTLTLTANPAGLAVGTYNTNLSITGSWPYNQSTMLIPVTLTVTPNPNAPTATVTGVVDGASYLGGTVAPGEVVVLFGSGIGPAKLTQAQPDPSGFPTSLDGWTVLFDKFPAPILYASSNQTAVMVPFEIASQTTTNVTVSTGATPSVPMSLAVAPTNPAVFTANSSGNGIAAALNVAADGSTTINMAAAPVAVGGIVTFYVSGLGVTTPVMQDGSLATAPLPTLNASVGVLLGGTNAKVLYAGPAPGEIAGLTQINIQVPSGLPGGLIPLLVTSGEAASQPGVTLAVK